MSGLNGAGSVLAYSSRDSTRIVKTFILTLQRYKLFLKVPNILGTFSLSIYKFGGE